MKITHQISNAVMALLLVTSTVPAESILGVRSPLGLPCEPMSGMGFAMGGTANALVDDYSLLLNNPANLGTLNRTMFSAHVLFDFLNIGEDDGVKRQQNFLNLVPQQFSLGFPMGSIGVLGASFTKRFNATVDYQQNFKQPLDAQVGFERDGGVNVWQIGWGYSFAKIATLGLAYERSFLNLEQRNAKAAQNGSTFIDTLDIEHGSNGLRGGILVPVQNFSLGLWAEYFFAADADGYAASSRSDTVYNQQSINFELALPPTVGIGVAYKFNTSWLAAADFDITLWDNYHSDHALLGLAPQELRDGAVRLSAGTQYTPAPELLTPRYWEIMHYRGGIRYNQLPMPSAYELAFSLGVGMPLPEGGGLVDLSIEYGRRHDKDFSNIREELFRFAIGINGGRKWNKSTQELSY